MLGRRQVMLAGLAAGTGSLLGRQALGAPRAAPPYHLLIQLGGGIDGIFTLDPKSKSEVDAKVDVPFNANQIVSAGELALGPHVASLLPWAGQLAILKGVIGGSVAHLPASSQINRMRRGVSTQERGLSFLDLVGTRRDTQPAPLIDLSPWKNKPSCTAVLGGTLFWRMQQASAEDLQLTSRVLAEQASQLERETDTQALATAERLRATAALAAAVPSVPRFKPEEWSKAPDPNSYAANLQCALWAFENDLALCVNIMHNEWDTHRVNEAGQARASLAFFPMLARFLEELGKRSNHRGRLIDNTRVIVTSELGRFPVLNAENGKHHFPEMPMLFIGAGIHGGSVFGATGRNMEGLGVDARTGKPTSKGGLRVSLDDVGTTLLKAVGVDAEVYGYAGRSLPFLV